MAIYHNATWNYNATREAIDYTRSIGEAILQPYIDQGFCSETEYYWDPADPRFGGGLYNIKRIWADYAKCQEWAAANNAARTADPIAVATVSDATVHDDLGYAPPA
jgi:hypothetical protein